MANQNHLNIIDHGPSVAKEWRQANPDTGFDLSGAKLSNRDLTNYDLSHSNLSGANFCKSNLSGCNLVESIISNTNFKSANLSNSHLHKLVRTDNANFSNTRIIGSSITRCEFINCDFSGAFIKSSNLHNTSFFEVDFNKCSFYNLSISNVKMTRSYGIHTSLGLDTLSFPPDQITSFETTIQEWPKKYFDWENLRTVGRLPLFGASYFALIVIPIYFYGLDIYNLNIELIRDWAIQSTQKDTITSKYLAEFIIDKVYPLPVPTRSLGILISTILLAFGSTLYTFFCPSRIKEFSKDQWVDELNKSLVNYWPFSWRNRSIRLLSSLFYIAGGFCLLLFLFEKLYGVILYVVKYS
ncbi:MAG: pentapeptide repeat-containing protein [Candidatus Thiodiazotropha endolucinida]